MLRMENQADSRRNGRPSRKLVVLSVLLPILSLLAGAAVAAMHYGVL